MLDPTHIRGPEISIIIPTYNAGQTLEPCLESVYKSSFRSFEVILVDDGSSDNSLTVAARFPCRIFELPRNMGSGAARNVGAREATGEILFFLDSDILVQAGSLATVSACLATDRTLSALFGSYTQETVPENFASRYKNLQHHYTHQISRENAVTFCGGFGAIRREVFEQLGGFDDRWRFLEDIEFGYRLRKAGHRVLLVKQLQFVHCKRYTFNSLIRSDVFGRAVPWTRLMLDTGNFHADLNTRWSNILSVPLAWALLLAPCAYRFPSMAVPLLLCAVAWLALNWSFVALARRAYGPWFAVHALFMCWLFYLYSAIGVALGGWEYFTGNKREEARRASNLPNL